MKERFTFGIPLIAKASAGDWPLVERLLALTLASVRAQTDQEFRILVVGHDRPGISPASFDFVQAEWPPEDVRGDNLDSGRKKTVICEHVLARGGGLLMFLDADDWVDRRLVEVARGTIAPGEVGGIITSGYATDVRNLRRIAIPHADLFDREFHRLCGSSIVARLDATLPDGLRRDPFAVMHEHYRWIETCREHGVAWRRLDVDGNYVVNTSANHSEQHGPYAGWRRDFAEGIARAGPAADDSFLGRFGLTRALVRSVLGPIADE